MAAYQARRLRRVNPRAMSNSPIATANRSPRVTSSPIGSMLRAASASASCHSG